MCITSYMLHYDCFSTQKDTVLGDHTLDKTDWDNGLFVKHPRIPTTNFYRGTVKTGHLWCSLTKNYTAETDHMQQELGDLNWGSWIRSWGISARHLYFQNLHTAVEDSGNSSFHGMWFNHPFRLGEWRTPVCWPISHKLTSCSHEILPGEGSVWGSGMHQCLLQG